VFYNIQLLFVCVAEITGNWGKRKWWCPASISARIYYSWREDSSRNARNAKTWRRTEVCVL